MLKTENLLKNRCRYYSHNERYYERHSPAFSACKRKPIRLNRRAAAPAASATVKIQKITKRAFNGRALQRLK